MDHRSTYYVLLPTCYANLTQYTTVDQKTFKSDDLQGEKIRSCSKEFQGKTGKKRGPHQWHQHLFYFSSCFKLITKTLLNWFDMNAVSTVHIL